MQNNLFRSDEISNGGKSITKAVVKPGLFADSMTKRLEDTDINGSFGQLGPFVSGQTMSPTSRSARREARPFSRRVWG